jgi:predicted aminopeptidase
MAISSALSRLAIALTLASNCVTGGCSTVGYYAQAIGGQMELMRKARPISEVLADAAVSEELKRKLERVVQIRNFASRTLALPDNDSYRRYADLHRPFVVWNVFATPELSVEPKEWCFPFAGCVGYKGYFSEADAKRFAAELRTQGDDVYIGGVPAYSTLGWFKDPVLNTFIRYPDAEIARLIFHELAHQVAYAKGDTTFNESFAVTVEEAGVHRWLAAHGTAEEKSAFDRAQVHRHAFLDIVGRYRMRLAQLYSGPLSADAMRAQKAEILAQMRRDYLTLKQQLDGLSGYDRWFGQPLNNAQLASVAIYNQLVPAFHALLSGRDGDLPSFYREVKRLASLPQSERDIAMQSSGTAAR